MGLWATQAQEEGSGPLSRETWDLRSQRVGVRQEDGKGDGLQVGTSPWL